MTRTQYINSLRAAFDTYVGGVRRDEDLIRLAYIFHHHFCNRYGLKCSSIPERNGQSGTLHEDGITDSTLYGIIYETSPGVWKPSMMTFDDLREAQTYASCITDPHEIVTLRH